MQSAAQDLSKEITVDRVVATEQKSVLKPTLMPTLVETGSEDVTLAPAEYLQPGTITNALKKLSAAAWADSIARTPYRGYASLGYFPALNLGVNAGYRIIDKENLTLGAWAQYNGAQYKSDGVKMRNNYITADIYGAWRPNEDSRLGIDAMYDFSSILHPSWVDEANNYTRSTNAFKGYAQWSSRVSDFIYKVGFGGSIFKFGNAKATFKDPQGNEFMPVKETSVKFDAMVGYVLGGHPLALDVDGQFLTSNAPNAGTLGQIQLKPNYTIEWRGFNFRLGANVGFGTGYADKKVTIAPDVRIDWAPKKSIIAAYLNLTGGQQLNPLSGIYAQDAYCSPFISYMRSNIPISAEAGVNFGTVAGFSFGLFGGWAYAKDWLMPVLNFGATSIPSLPIWASAYGGTAYASCNVKSWQAGLRLSYEYGTLIKVSGMVATAGSNDANATWYAWLDRAKYVADASLRVTPIDPLDIEVAYSLRACRKAVAPKGETVNLGNISNLSVGASYRITPALTVFARVENILNRHPLLISGLPGQGICGAIGVAYKF